GTVRRGRLAIMRRGRPAAIFFSGFRFTAGFCGFAFLTGLAFRAGLGEEMRFLIAMVFFRGMGKRAKAYARTIAIPCPGEVLIFGSGLFSGRFEIRKRFFEGPPLN